MVQPPSASAAGAPLPYGRRWPSTEGALCEVLPDEAETPEAQYERLEWEALVAGRVSAALAKLEPREREIARERLMRDDPTTHLALSERYGVSRTRIWELDLELRKALRVELADLDAA